MTNTTLRPCDAPGCPENASVDFGRYVRVAAGIYRHVRRLCCRHARGMRAHAGCTACRAEQRA